LDVVKNYWTQFKIFGPLSENSSPHLVSQASYGPDCIDLRVKDFFDEVVVRLLLVAILVG